MFKHKSTIYTDTNYEHDTDTNSKPDVGTDPKTFTDTDADADADTDADTDTDTRITPVSLITLLAVLVCDYIPSIDSSNLIEQRLRYNF